MNTPFLHASHKPARFLRVALSLGMSLGAYGALVMPAASLAATPGPVVDQQPLTVRPSIPPDIMLMLDDSGSMTWDVMPDWDYLPAPNWSNISNNWNEFVDVDVMPLIDSDINGVYYNPTITYLLPPKLDGTTYPQADFDAALYDGFDSGSPAVDLSTYRGKYDSNDTTYEASSVQYSISVAKLGATSYARVACPSGWSNSTKYSGYCSHDGQPSIPFSFYDTTNHYFYLSRCNSIQDVYNASAGTCTPGISFFTYATTNPLGGYIRHYVGKNTGDCAAVGLSSTVCDDSAAARDNVANWFSYYHRRILMAKSGMLIGFNQLSPLYRFGYGDIHDGIISNVKPFGDGSAGTQKAAFWAWVIGKTVGGGTPLRNALATVGNYYKTSQPWSAMAGDPGYTVGDTTQLACRAAYTILTTDGFWNGSYSSSTIAGASDRAGTTVTGPNAQTYTYSALAPYSGGGTGVANSPSLADVAMYYWETDLQPSIDNEVPVSTEDPAFWQHMSTFTMGMGFPPVGIQPTGTTANQIFSWANGGGAIGGFSWPKPSPDNGGSANNIADLAHAGVNGHGDFFSVKSPQGFVASILSALKRVSSRVGTGASLAANSTSLTNGTVIYQANYYTSVWKGDLKALSVNPANGAIATAPSWEASQEMPAASSRDIETYNPSTGTFVPFQNGSGAPPSLDSAQLTALGSSSTDQQSMVNYLRGDSAGEQRNGGSFRNRDTALGDIVDSQPVYSGPPPSNEFINRTFLGNIVDPVTGTIPFYDWAVGTTSGGTFTASAASTRTALVFVAANDGMLHAFNAGNYNSTTKSYDSGTGAEVYAYLPGAVITAGLKDTSDPGYGSAADPHQYYNDGQLTIADAYIQTAGESAPSWHTILVGTTGKGLAEAVYALDVTDPSNITPLWERSAGDGLSGSNYIGQMVGKPVIAQTSYTPAAGGVAASSAWSVLIGNGFNSAAGVSALLQFNLATGALSVHTTTDTTAGNGLAAPVAWMDTPTNGVADIAYAGDLHGNVWSFALNDITGSNPTPTSTGSLLFVAKDSGNKIQPITAGMLAGKDPSTGDVWLLFGTGEYLNTSDLTNTDTQSWYGIIVQSSDATLVSNLANGRNALVQRTITAQTAGGGGVLPARSISAEVINPDGTTDMTGKSGWYLDLEAPSNTGPIQQGERMVDSSEFQGSLLIGVTRIPQVTDLCNPSGTGWIMAVDPFTGAPPSSDFFDINNDGFTNSGDRVNGSVAAGVGFGSLPNAPIFVGGVMETSFDNGTTSSILTSGSVGGTKRVSWRELVNP